MKTTKQRNFVAKQFFQMRSGQEVHTPKQRKKKYEEQQKRQQLSDWRFAFQHTPQYGLVVFLIRWAFFCANWTSCISC